MVKCPTCGKTSGFDGDFHELICQSCINKALDPKMREPKQIRSELKHQKKLASQNKDSLWLHQKYMTRVHLLSWVLGESSTF